MRGSASGAPRRADTTCTVAMTAPTVALTQKNVNITSRSDLRGARIHSVGDVGRDFISPVHAADADVQKPSISRPKHQ